MRFFGVMFTLLLSIPALADALQARVNSPLLDHLVGQWVLHGDIAGQEATHDVDADWVLEHHYLRLHEISREKTSQGKPQYEATIYIAWNEAPKQYAAIWLDVYGGFSAESIGIAAPKQNELLFRFPDEKGALSVRNDFLYNAKADA